MVVEVLVVNAVGPTGVAVPPEFDAIAADDENYRKPELGPVKIGTVILEIGPQGTVILHRP
jgi:hypothetical protein